MNLECITHFGIIRHAPTEWNESKRIQGRQDSPLSPRGKAMAGEWGRQLCEYDWDRLLCGDQQRAQETAARINLVMGLPVHTDARLREQDWGEWTGMTVAELNQRDRSKVVEQEQRGWEFRPPGGESRIEVLRRSRDALNDAHFAWTGENILVVSHEGVIKCLLYHLLGRGFLPGEPRIPRGYQLHMLAVGRNGLALEKMDVLSLHEIPTDHTT